MRLAISLTSGNSQWHYSLNPLSLIEVWHFIRFLLAGSAKQ